MRSGRGFGLAAMLLASSCAGPATSPPPSTVPEIAPDSAESAALEGTTWRLQQIGDRPLVVSSHENWPTLSFDREDGVARGNSGCNHFAGSYELDGRSLRIGALATAKMACPRHERETEYLRVLEGTRSWSVFDGRLVLQGANAEPLARFEAAPAP